MSHTTQGLLQRLPSLSLLGSSSPPWTALTVTTGGAGEGGQAQDYLRHRVGDVSLPQGSTRIPLFRGYTDDVLMKVISKRLLMKSSSGLTTYNRPSSESAPSSPTAIRMEWSSHLKSLSSQRRRWSSRGSRSPGRESSRLTSTWRVRAYQPSCLKFRQDRTHGSIPSPLQPVHTLPVER